MGPIRFQTSERYRRGSLSGTNAALSAFTITIPTSDRVEYIPGDFNGDKIGDVAIFVSGTAFTSAGTMGMYLLMASIGEWNADGRRDFGMVDSNLSRTIRLFAGKPLIAQGGPIGPIAPAVPYAYSNATSVLASSNSSLLGINLFQTAANQSTATIPAIEGSAPNQQLRELRPIGDWNGDRYEDFLAISPTRADIILGPYDQARNASIEDATTVTVGLYAGLGATPYRVSLNAADFEPVSPAAGSSSPLTRDGRSDVAFIQEVYANGSHLLISVLFGSSNPSPSIHASETTSSLAIRVSFYNESNGIISGPVTIGTSSSGTNWNSVSATVTAPPLTRSIRVVLDANTPINVGTVDFDQVSLVAISNPVILGETLQDGDGDPLR